MRSGHDIYLVLAACVAGLGQPSLAIAQPAGAEPRPVEGSVAGLPIVAARRQAIAAAAFHRTLDPDAIRKWMRLGSQCTIAEFELFLAPLSPQETMLLQKVEQMTAPIVNRLHFGHLRSVLKRGGIVALEIEDEARRNGLPHTTSAVENDLYGAFDCVFASVGPLNGTPRYGDVVIRLKDSVRENGWATPFSGMHFLSAIRGQDAAEMQTLLAAGRSLPTKATNPLSLGFDDRLHFSHDVVTEQEWSKALAYQAILVLRNADDSESGDRIRKRCETMLHADDPGTFWALFIPPRVAGLTPIEQTAQIPFGYLEAKFPGSVSINEFTSIEVPAEKLDEVRGWPEAKPYLDLIHMKPNGVD